MKMVSKNERYADYLTVAHTSWKKPEGPPRIWRVVEGRKKMNDGNIPKFSIQGVPEELEQDVVEFMEKYFIREEPTSASLDIENDSLALREFRTVWKNALGYGVSVVALRVDSVPTAQPVIVGINFLTVVRTDDEENPEGALQYRSKKMRVSTAILVNLAKESKVFERYGVSSYLGGAGLCVHPSFRGQGIGEEILRTRDDIGIEYKIPVSETIFSGIASQLLAIRVGYEVLLEKKYTELIDEEGNLIFPGVMVEHIKVMGKRLY